MGYFASLAPAKYVTVKVSVVLLFHFRRFKAVGLKLDSLWCSETKAHVNVVASVAKTLQVSRLHDQVSDACRPGHTISVTL